MRRILLTKILIFTVSVIFGQISTLMPLAESVIEKQGYFTIDQNTQITIGGLNSQRLINYTDKTLRRISQKTGIFISQDYLNKNNLPANATIEIHINRIAENKFGEDDSYKLVVNPDKITISSETDYGAFNALETLYQLVEVRDDKYVFPSCEINDKARFSYRGLMLDVSRHFLSIETIKTEIDLMSSVKMNVLHWHLSDDHGFRVEIKKYPQLQEKASDGLFYTQEQIREIVKYASDRGIIVIPEIDMPGHASAFLTAFPELSSNWSRINKIERNSGIFRPVIDPSNPETYLVIEDIISEMSSLFPCEFFHIGGDENEGLDWKENKTISKFMKDNGIETVQDFQAYFNLKVNSILKKYGKTIMGYEEIQNPLIDKNSIIQVWHYDESMMNALNNGYTVILSHGYYINLLEPASFHYKNKIVPDSATAQQQKLIIGGETPMWAELITDLNIDTRIWPRAAVIAERLWSPKEKTKDVDDMYRRLQFESSRLDALGSNHFKSKDQIIRMISNNVNTSAIELLVNTCEPLKQYARNVNGTMYKSYSPFTKFADACTADASEDYKFKNLISELGNDKNKVDLAYMFKSWIDNHHLFLIALQSSPQLKEVELKSQNLKYLGQIGLKYLHLGKIDEDEFQLVIGKLNSIYLEHGARCELIVAKTMEKYLEKLKVD